MRAHVNASLIPNAFVNVANVSLALALNESPSPPIPQTKNYMKKKTFACACNSLVCPYSLLHCGQSTQSAGSGVKWSWPTGYSVKCVTCKRRLTWFCCPIHRTGRT